MPSRTKCKVSSPEVHTYARGWMEPLKFQDHGPKCTKSALFQILFLAAARMCSIPAACRDMSHAPTGQAVHAALTKLLPSDAAELQTRLNLCLRQNLPKALLRRARHVAMDLTLIPYHGEPHEDPNELRHSTPKSGTTKFHGYATAYVIENGFRYTLYLIRVTGDMSMKQVVQTLLRQVRALGIRVKLLLLDRGFYSVEVVRYLKRARCPFVMPVAMRGRKPKGNPPPTGLRAFRRKRSGWYEWTMSSPKQGLERVKLCVAGRRYKHKKTGKTRVKKLVFAAWGYRAAPLEIRELYRKRFGIETSYRQMNQGRIRTCTRNPIERLLFFALALVLRNVWVWIHYKLFAAERGPEPTLRLELMRFRRMLDWLADFAISNLHSGENYSMEWEP